MKLTEPNNSSHFSLSCFSRLQAVSPFQVPGTWITAAGKPLDVKADHHQTRHRQGGPTDESFRYSLPWLLCQHPASKSRRRQRSRDLLAQVLEQENRQAGVCRDRRL